MSQGSVMFFCVLYRKPLTLEDNKKKIWKPRYTKVKVGMLDKNVITLIYSAKDNYILITQIEDNHKKYIFCQHLIQAEQIKSKDLSNCSLYNPFQSHKPHIVFY